MATPQSRERGPAYVVTRVCVVTGLVAVALAAVPGQRATPLPPTLAAASAPSGGEQEALPVATELPPSPDPSPTATSAPPPAAPSPTPTPTLQATKPQPVRTSPRSSPRQSAPRQPAAPLPAHQPDIGDFTVTERHRGSPNAAPATDAPENPNPEPVVTASQGLLPTFAPLAAEDGQATNPWVTRALIIVSVLIVIAALTIATASLRRRMADDPVPEERPAATG